MDIWNNSVRQTGSGINRHHCCYRNISLMSSRKWSDIGCWTQRRSDSKPPMGNRLTSWSLTLDDLEVTVQDQNFFIVVLSMEFHCLWMIAMNILMFTRHSWNKQANISPIWCLLILTFRFFWHITLEISYTFNTVVIEMKFRVSIRPVSKQ